MKTIFTISPLLLFFVSCSVLEKVEDGINAIPINNYYEKSAKELLDSQRALIRTGYVNIRRLDGEKTTLLGRDNYYIKPGTRHLTLNFETSGAVYSGSYYIPASMSYEEVTITTQLSPGKVYAIKGNKRLAHYGNQISWSPELVEISRDSKDEVIWSLEKQ